MSGIGAHLPRSKLPSIKLSVSSSSVSGRLQPIQSRGDLRVAHAQERGSGLYGSVAVAVAVVCMYGSVVAVNG